MITSIRGLLRHTIITLSFFSSLSSVFCQSGFYSSFNPPDLPGERQLSVDVELKGLPLSSYKVYCYYSNDSTIVARALNERTRTGNETYADARLVALANDKARASIILPHRDAPQPNVNDNNPKVYNHPTKVYYAFVRSNRPAAATSELLINSPVMSFTMPRVLVIAYMGDSYAAGEGAPDENAEFVAGVKTKDADWVDDDCHRSNKSGGMLAIFKLIDKHPEFAIRYVNTSCSGATLSDFTTPDMRTNFIGGVAWSKPPQFEQLQSYMQRNNRSVIDIIMTDGGGNDVGFAPVATDALTGFFRDVSKDDQFQQFAALGLASLPEAYEDINTKIQSEHYGFKVGRVIWFNYPNPLTDKNGALCSPTTNGIDLSCWGLFERNISLEDMTYLKNEVFNKLNAAVKTAADTCGWDFVDISSRSLRHGLCNCDEPYFNTMGQSWGIQGDIQGTMHPNARGFREIYRDALFNQLEKSISLWHKELKKDAKDRAIAQAKEKAAANAREQAAAAAAKARFQMVTNKRMTLIQAAKDMATRLSKGIKPEKPRLDLDDLKSSKRPKLDIVD